MSPVMPETPETRPPRNGPIKRHCSWRKRLGETACAEAAVVNKSASKNLGIIRDHTLAGASTWPDDGVQCIQPQAGKDVRDACKLMPLSASWLPGRRQFRRMWITPGATAGNTQSGCGATTGGRASPAGTCQPAGHRLGIV